jgi:hypothetical protein
MLKYYIYLYLHYNTFEFFIPINIITHYEK